MNKTGISEAAIAAFVTSFVLGFLPFAGVSVGAVQALNIGLVVGAVGAWILRWKAKHKAKKNAK